MLQLHRNRRLIAVAAGAVLALQAFSARAADVQPGTILSAANIDQIQNLTLDGHRIGDLLTGSQEHMIRNLGWRMKLVPATPLVLDQRLIDLTEKHAGEAKLDANLQVTNFTAGIPFPVIDPDNDPQAGVKLAYNILRPAWLGDNMDLNPMYFLVINGKKGLEREQGWRFKRFLLNGRTAQPHTLETEKQKYESLINLYPQDTRGLGILTVGYSDDRLADVYAYIKSVRRVRRLSSGAWADPIAATDILTDETFGLNLNPAWYDSWEILEKRWILGTAHGEIEPINRDARNPQERFPAMELDKAPYWNYLEAFEPREVWVLKATPPAKHLVGHRMMYVSTVPNAPSMFWQEYFDKKGDLWRILHVGYSDFLWSDVNKRLLGVSIVAFFDLQRMHATVLYSGGDEWTFNIPDANQADYTPEALPRQLQ